MDQIIPFEGAVLEIFLHGIHLNHTVGDRCTGRKHNAAASGQLVQIPTLHIEVARLHGFRLADTAHVPHFRERGEVLVVVCLVNENTVNAELFKGHDIILPGLVVQLVEPLLDRLLCALQLLDGEVVASISFELCYAFQHLIELLLQNSSLSLNGHWDLLELAVPDNHRVIVAGCDSAAKLLSVLGLEVFLRCHEDVRRGV